LQVAQGDQAFADVTVASDIDHPLPASVDPSKLRQVLWNLLRNAADAAALGGKHVQITARRDGTDVTIAVADDGPGIAPEHLARIFDPFFTTKSKGTGLGLATCHAIVAEHGGRIDAESTVGKGTKMMVRIPRER
jgi:signal transduction histidine kinase